MRNPDTSIMTPWQKVHARFGVSASELARILGRHRSKISRAISDERGLINGRDQELIISAAKLHGVKLPPSDLLPGA